MRNEATAGHNAVTWTDVPTHLLQAELSRRQETAPRPQCGSGDEKHAYNTPLHVFALFLILVLSVAACSFPIIVKRFPRLPVPHHALFLSRHFGTGVSIATAFVHLLPTAYTSLTDPCSPPFWTDGYPAMAGFIAMVSVMVVVGVEMFFAMKGAGHTHGSEYDTSGGEGARRGAGDAGHGHGHGQGHGRERPMRPQHQRTESLRPFKQGKIGPDSPFRSEEALAQAQGFRDGSDDIEMNGVNGTHKRRSSQDQDDDDSDLDLDESDPEAGDTSGFLTGHNTNTTTRYHDHDPATDSGATSPLPLHATHTRNLSSSIDHAAAQKQLLQCLLLEAGILFHSVFIGMAVSVSTGPAFIVLLIAISFHQTFEGLALGSRIAAIPLFGPESPKPWLMALAYGTTTPLGQAIGLGVRGLYDPASQGGLSMVGVMNAVSSGLLSFAGLVELLAEDFLSDESYATLRGVRRSEACASVVAGTMLMALVGAWA